jgi:hypothetical protein
VPDVRPEGRVIPPDGDGHRTLGATSVGPMTPTTTHRTEVYGSTDGLYFWTCTVCLEGAGGFGSKKAAHEAAGNQQNHKSR